MKTLIRSGLLGLIVGYAGALFPAVADECVDGCHAVRCHYYKYIYSGGGVCLHYFSADALSGRVTVDEGGNPEQGQGQTWWEECPGDDCNLVCDNVDHSWIESDDGCEQARDCTLGPPETIWIWNNP